jgi:hypothetical protein
MQDIRDRLGSKESVKESVKGAVTYKRKQFSQAVQSRESVGIRLKKSQSGSKTQADSGHQRREMD